MTRYLSTMLGESTSVKLSEDTMSALKMLFVNETEETEYHVAMVGILNIDVKKI